MALVCTYGTYIYHTSRNKNCCKLSAYYPENIKDSCYNHENMNIMDAHHVHVFGNWIFIHIFYKNFELVFLNLRYKMQGSGTTFMNRMIFFIICEQTFQICNLCENKPELFLHEVERLLAIFMHSSFHKCIFNICFWW